jgi:hypothetical protein
VRQQFVKSFSNTICRAKSNAVVSLLAAFENYGDKVLLILDLLICRRDRRSRRAEVRSFSETMPVTASRASFFGWLFRGRLGLTGRRTLRRFLGRGGFLSARRGDRSLLFGSLFVGIASVVSGIESRSLEDQTCAGTEKTLHFAVPPLRQPAELFWAFAKWLVAHRLECVEVLATLLTGILVSWHQEYGSARSADNAGKSALNEVQFNPEQIVN